MILEIHVKRGGRAVVVLEYEHGTDFGKTGLEHFSEAQYEGFVRYICEKIGFPPVDIIELRNNRRHIGLEYDKMRGRVDALEEYAESNNVDLKEFYRDNVPHESLVQFNIERKRNDG